MSFAALCNRSRRLEKRGLKRISKARQTNLKKGLKLSLVRIGKDDFMLSSSRLTVELLNERGFTPVSRESNGGHTWIN